MGVFRAEAQQLVPHLSTRRASLTLQCSQAGMLLVPHLCTVERGQHVLYRGPPLHVLYRGPRLDCEEQNAIDVHAGVSTCCTGAR